ncbi:MAG: hypothetical protein JW893_04900 [Candidatus Omnitrophica bacterium]|nr:hypothetical protein [Candidatus Omnitrophota bacterium]
MRELTEKKKVAFERLRELGVKIEELEHFYDFSIPHDLRDPRYIEIGFLLAQLNDDQEYPKGYSILCDLDSKIYSRITEPGPVHFRESYPDFLLYRVYKKK